MLNYLSTAIALINIALIDLGGEHVDDAVINPKKNVFYQDLMKIWMLSLQFDKSSWCRILTLKDSSVQESEMLKLCFYQLLQLIFSDVAMNSISSLLRPSLPLLSLQGQEQSDRSISSSLLKGIIEHFTNDILLSCTFNEAGNGNTSAIDDNKQFVKIRMTNLIHSFFSNLM
jgi:hypothetical protein